MFESSIIAELIGLAVFLFIIVKRLYTVIKRWKSAPKPATFVAKVETNSQSNSKLQPKKGKRKRIRNAALASIIYEGVFGGTIAWATMQLIFILMNSRGWELQLPDPWYGSTETLIIIIIILGFQVVRYVRKAFEE